MKHAYITPLCAAVALGSACQLMAGSDEVDITYGGNAGRNNQEADSREAGHRRSVWDDDVDDEEY